VGTGVIDALELGMVGAGVMIGGVPAGAKALPGTLGGLLLGRLGGLLLGRLGGLLLGLVVRGFVLVCAKRTGSAATQIPMMPKNFISLI
jgi:hypothetical protein